MWMLSSAAWETKRVRVGRSHIDLQRGQLAFALRFLARKFQWTDSRVRRLLKRLETDAMIVVLATREATQVTICNYDEYQFKRRTGDAQTDAQTDVEPTHPRRKEEEINNIITNNSVANATDAKASDPRARLFREGLATLRRLTGKGPDSCRSFLGKCLKEAGDDAIVVLAAIENAERNRVIDPSAYIARLLKGRSNGQSRSGIIQAADDLCRKLASFDGPTRGADELRSGTGEAPPRLLSHGRGQ